MKISIAGAMFLAFGLVGQAVTPVWIDTDPSVAPGGHEVDDGFALLQALHSPEIAVKGISIVFGNAPLDAAFPIGERLAQNFETYSVKVFRGASGPQDLGRETDATRALASALRRERLTILALGPVTNIASVIQLHPKLASRIERVVAVAGRRPGQHFSTGKAATPFRDFNFEKDPTAFAVLLHSNIPLVLAPWEISSKIWLTAADLQALKTPDETRTWLISAASDWLGLWKKKFGVNGFNPFDTLAVGYVTWPSLYECQSLPVEIRKLPDDVKPGEKKPYLLVSEDIHSSSRALYCYNAKSTFKADLLKQLAPKLNHTLWNQLLQEYVTNNARVNYRDLKANDQPKLRQYLALLGKPWPKNMNSAEQKAALINAYNAFTVSWIVDNYPIQSIWETPRPFKEARHTMDGKKVSLDQIETRLRKGGDPRIHATIVCASLSCPPLRNEAYVAERLDRQIDENVRRWLANPALNEFEPTRHTAVISMIFKWYRADFETNGSTVKSFLLHFAPSGKAQFLHDADARLEYKTYRWGLNDTSNIGESYSELQFYKDVLKNKL